MAKPMTQKLILDPFQRFIAWESSSGIILFLAALTALIWANSPWQAVYFHLRHVHFIIGFEGWALNLPFHSWINDGLMAVFFFMVGLEIKRELLVGELSQIRHAALPVMAAIGGMLVPAILYLLINPPGTPYHQGWGIPTVTDIAFSLGVLTLLGNRIPLSLKVFLTALAIIDDLGAVLLIAIFYSTGIQWGPCLLALVIFGLLVLMNRLRVRWIPAYLALGAALWLAMLHSGIHSTIAGVLLAITIPASSKIKATKFGEEGLAVLHMMQHLEINSNTNAMIAEDDYQSGVQNLETLCEEVQAPLQRLEHALNPWVTYGIMPLFAFANAGVSFSADSLLQSITHPITFSIVIGLVLGKQLGITLFSWLSVKLGFADLPENTRWVHLYGLACLGGIGFTMSLFISGLAFGSELADLAKVGIILASLISGLWGWFVLNKTVQQL